MHHLTNIGPNAEAKVAKARELTGLPLVHRPYPGLPEEMGWDNYDFDAAVKNDLHSMYVERQLTDQEMFELWRTWFQIKM